MLSYSKDVIQDLTESVELIVMGCLKNLINFVSDTVLHDEL